MGQDLTEQKVELEMGEVLRWGVLIGAFVMLLGGILYLTAYGRANPAYGRLIQTAGVTGIGAIFREAFAMNGSSIIQLGVLLLIATPVARVVFAAYAFFRERDWMYTSISLIVLAVLMFGIFHGI